jgi:hypothetical protein
VADSRDDQGRRAPRKPRSALADLRDRLAGWLDELRDELSGLAPVPVLVPVTGGRRPTRRR